MTFQRLLAIVIALVLLSRLWPVVGPWIWPALKPRVDRLRRRADIAAASVMIALVLATLFQGERAYAALVAV
ncbi:MAG: hypothetical protein ACXWP4_15080, partial [Polyangiales bacterium]